MWPRYVRELGFTIERFSDLTDWIQTEVGRAPDIIPTMARMMLSSSHENQLNITNHRDVRNTKQLGAMLRDAFQKALPLMDANPHGDTQAMYAAKNGLITDVYVEYPNSFTGGWFGRLEKCHQ